MFNKRNVELKIFSLLSIIILFFPMFINFKKTRIQLSVSLNASTSLGPGFKLILIGCVIVFLLSLIRNKHENIYYLCGLLSGILVVTTLYYMSNALDWLPLDKTPYSRLTIGVSMWIWLFIMFGIIILCSKKIHNEFKKKSIIIVPLIILLILLATDNLSDLGIVMEYQTKKDQLWTELVKHVKISAGVVISAILIGVPLGYLINRSEKLDRIVFNVLNITETLPAISFISILMIPLNMLYNKYSIFKELDISGFGVAPAFIALLFYALFPVLHNTRAAFKSIDGSYLEVAKSMGMRYARIFFTVEVPIALPIILSGIRMAVLFTIPAVSLAVFTGGGGLGVFLVQSESMDLILLGTIPIVVITFLFDSILSKIIAKARY